MPSYHEKEWQEYVAQFKAPDNARLIAAAPELAAVCQLIYEELDQVYDVDEESGTGKRTEYPYAGAGRHLGALREFLEKVGVLAAPPNASLCPWALFRVNPEGEREPAYSASYFETEADLVRFAHASEIEHYQVRHGGVWQYTSSPAGTA